MDSQKDIDAGIVRLVTAPARNLSRNEEAPRPYEAGWVQEQIRRNQAEREAKKLFPLPGGFRPYDQNHVARINEGFANRKQYVEQKLKRHYPPA